MYRVGKSVEILYDRDSELKKEDVLEILDWNEHQLHLPKITEYEVALFLRARTYKVNDAKKNIENYYTFKTNNPKLFAKRDAVTPEIQQVIEDQLHIALPGTTVEGHKAIFFKMVNPDTSKFNFTGTFRTISMLTDWWHLAEGTAEGHVIVVDFQGFTFGHIMRINLFILKAFVTYAQDLLPIRLRGIHFINATKFAQRFISILRPLLKKDVSAVLNVHLTMDTVFEVIPRESFPQELGGTWKPLKELQEEMRDLLVTNRKNFLEDDIVRKVKK
ncbi:hypothetical protein DMENIID0001_019070 [Sergentomyia squamirostris]